MEFCSPPRDTGLDSSPAAEAQIEECEIRVKKLKQYQWGRVSRVPFNCEKTHKDRLPEINGGNSIWISINAKTLLRTKNLRLLVVLQVFRIAYDSYACQQM